jgi:hypothetical protein
MFYATVCSDQRGVLGPGDDQPLPGVGFERQDQGARSAKKTLFGNSRPQGARRARQGYKGQRDGLWAGTGVHQQQIGPAAFERPACRGVARPGGHRIFAVPSGDCCGRGREVEPQPLGAIWQAKRHCTPRRERVEQGGVDLSLGQLPQLERFEPQP